jgi:tetratricopeptide (TPR) repeat protein
MAFHEFEPPNEAFPRARTAAECALAIAPELGEAHAALAYVELHHDRNWAGAERTFQRAIELNPNHAVTRLWYVNLLAVSARFEEALEQCQRAIELDPLSIVHNLVTGWVLFFQRRYDVAYQRMERALELEPGFFQAYYWRGWALWKMGRAEEAAAHLETSSRLAQHAPTVLHLRALNAAFAGRLDDAREILSRMEAMRGERYVSAFAIGLGHAVVGDLDAAEPWIERAAAERSPWIGFMKVDSRVEALRGRPRMDAIRDRLGERV